MSTEFKWDPPPLSEQDQRLIDAYLEIGRTVDELAYTEDFDELVRRIHPREESQQAKREVYRRLLHLRKQARLPRIWQSSSSSGE